LRRTAPRMRQFSNPASVLEVLNAHVALYCEIVRLSCWARDKSEPPPGTQIGHSIPWSSQVRAICKPSRPAPPNSGETRNWWYFIVSTKPSALTLLNVVHKAPKRDVCT